jgi:CRISPR-associated endonuclease/helicase Cas3
MFYAHSIKDQPECKWEPLPDHLRAVAMLAETFAAKFGLRAHGQAAGWLHDLGKYSDEFQKKIRRQSNKDAGHALAGALEALHRYGVDGGGLLAYAVAGHHAGLADGPQPSEAGHLGDRFQQTPDLGWERGLAALVLPPREDLDAEFSDFMARKRFAESDTAQTRAHAYARSFLGRMLFSALVDADFLATEQFLNQDKALARQAEAARPEQLAAVLAAYLDAKPLAAPVDHQRRTVLTACRAMGRDPARATGVYTLVVPTGGGKTLSSLSFALEHAATHGLDRVIYAIPFTAITDQTAAVFRDVLGADAVLEHTGTADPTGVGDEEPVGPDRMALAAENWDAPVVVTTTVQLFQSLHAARPSHCRKLHNLARSVIVLDEVQALPIPALAPCLAALRELASGYGTTIVLMSATLPDFDQPSHSLQVHLPPATPILAPAALDRQVFTRTRAEPIGTLDDAAVANRMAAQQQVLTIVETITQARAIYARLPMAGRYHLSAAMTPAHRTATLDTIRRALQSGQPCRVTATRVVEAGVDISFPRVIRLLAGVDSLAQAAGRCNRHGELQDRLGRFEIFIPADHKAAWPDNLRDLKLRVELAKESLQQFPDPLTDAAIADYFARLLQLKSNSQDIAGCYTKLCKPRKPRVINMTRLTRKVQAKLWSFPYREVAQHFRLFEQGGAPVIVPYHQGDADVQGLVDAVQVSLSIHPQDRDRDALLRLIRTLRRHSVDTYQREALIAAGAADALDKQGRFFVLTDAQRYCPDTGLVPLEQIHSKRTRFE